MKTDFDAQYPFKQKNIQYIHFINTYKNMCLFY